MNRELTYNEERIKYRFERDYERLQKTTLYLGDSWTYMNVTMKGL